MIFDCPNSNIEQPYQHQSSGLFSAGDIKRPLYIHQSKSEHETKDKITIYFAEITIFKYKRTD